MREIRYYEALIEAMAEEMRLDEDVFLMGEDIGLFGGTFRATEGLMAEFGSRRVRDTPIAEAGIVGLALGAAFAGLRPVPERAVDVAAPPYDVLDTAEARERADSRPLSFLHISKPEIDLPDGTDPFAPEVYAKGADNLQRMIDENVLVRDTAASFYVYRLRMDGHEQEGLVFAASIAEYDNNRIRRHELTQPYKEDDRVRQITALNAQTGPVLLAYRSSEIGRASCRARV